MTFNWPRKVKAELTRRVSYLTNAMGDDSCIRPSLPQPQGLSQLPVWASRKPPGITRGMIERALPREGAPLAGPYKVTSEPAFGSPGHLVFRPATLPLEGAKSRQATADDLRAAIDWAGKENERAGSPLQGKIAMDKVAVMGHSCGGFLSIALGADPRVRTIGVFNSGVQKAPSPYPTADALPKLHGPVLLVNGGEPDLVMATSAATFDLISHVPDCGLCTNANWDTRSKGIN